MNSEWKRHEELNNHVDLREYLVTWIDRFGYFSTPVLAYWCEAEQRFFLLNADKSFPLDVDYYCEYPNLPDKI